MAFTLKDGARHSLTPPKDGHTNDAADFASMLQTAWSLPLTGLSTLGFDPTRHQTEPPACYPAA